MRIDGVDLVVWQVPGEADAEDGGWRVMSDACPHRLAPLSEGHFAQSSMGLGRQGAWKAPRSACSRPLGWSLRWLVRCAYHGWEFDGQGSCTKIPQVEARLRAGPSKPWHRRRRPERCARASVPGPGGGAHKAFEPRNRGRHRGGRPRTPQVASFPTKLCLELVWVWLGSGEPKGHPRELVQGEARSRNSKIIYRIL